MKILKIVLFLVLISCNTVICAKAPELSLHELATPPHRVIRTCCVFGSNLHMMIIPILKYTDITCIEELGPHCYLGNAGEGNGIIYSQRGGFVDMGHVRDQADWTAYLFSRIELAKEKGSISINLGHEGGSKTLNIKIPADINNADAALLAGRIAYDLSVWHEIATWYGSSAVPFFPERYSSFSIEDAYSNLLGVTIGMQAVKSNLSYEVAMTGLIGSTLETLGAVISEDEIYMAREAVRNFWWTRKWNLPSRKILIERQLGVYTCLEPWRVPGWAGLDVTSYDLSVPDKTSDGRPLNNFYGLDFKLNHKFPLKKIFASKSGRRVTQEDFGQLISHIAKDLETDKLR
jgi:hypothetical protein